MRLGPDIGARGGSPRLWTLEAARDHGECVRAHGRQDGAGQQQTRQGALQDVQDRGGCTARVGRGRGAGMSGSAHQRTQVVGQHLGGHVHQHSMLTQAADGFELEAPLQSLGGFLDTSAAVVQRNESHAK